MGALDRIFRRRASAQQTLEAQVQNIIRAAAAQHQCVWYDPSDLSTMFQDSAGTTPVTAVEQSVGLILDKSKGLALGAELATNGDFSNGATGWTLDSGWSVSGGQATFVPGAAGTIRQGPMLVTGRFYNITFDVIATSGTGSIAAFLSGDIPANVITVPNSVGRKTVILPRTGLSNFGIRGDAAASFTIDNISVRELPGNHASQATTGYKPVLSARVNLLTKTEELGTSPWNALGFGTASAPARTDAYAQSPIGTQKATRLQFALNGGTTSSDISQLVQNYSAVPSGAACLFAIWLRSTDGVSSYTMQIGVVGATQNVTITGQWTRFVVAGTGNGSAFDFQLRLRGGQAPAHSNAADVLAWGADLRLANIPGCPEYQRVNTATDYDTVGFPRYLKFDGSDDFLVTSSIDFSTTDKVAVAAGVRKLSDAAAGIIAELSANAGANSGAFYLASALGSAANYGGASRGTITASVATPNDYASPNSSVISSISSISSDALKVRALGVERASVSSDQGSGNYGNYPLYIGRRAGSSLPFNGHLYGLVVCGGMDDIAKVAKIERLLAKKTGVTV